MIATLKIHLTTDRVTGGLTIDFDPVDDDYIPVDHAEWSGLTTDGVGLRDKLRNAVRADIADDEVWEAYLDSNRIGERLDVLVGTATVTDDSDITAIEIEHTHPKTINW